MSFHRTSLHPRISSFRPVGDKVLLRRHPRPSESSGIVIPTTAGHTDLARFSVVDTGPKCQFVAQGDIALAPAQLAFGIVDLNGVEMEIAPEHILSAYVPSS